MLFVLVAGMLPTIAVRAVRAVRAVCAVRTVHQWIVELEFAM